MYKKEEKYWEPWMSDEKVEHGWIGNGSKLNKTIKLGEESNSISVLRHTIKIWDILKWIIH